MKRKLRKFDRYTVIRFELLDTPGDEVAPGSDKVGKHFENERLGHNPSVWVALEWGDSTVPDYPKSKAIVW